ncbi:hypothetical protein [Streptomyces roseoverticillatus]|nr:hypothetical protein [Streptomyces roseoverticillatus]
MITLPHRNSKITDRVKASSPGRNLRPPRDPDAPELDEDDGALD